MEQRNARNLQHVVERLSAVGESSRRPFRQPERALDDLIAQLLVAGARKSDQRLLEPPFVGLVVRIEQRHGCCCCRLAQISARSLVPSMP